MYLLKLRHGDAFCTVTGSSWRLIFVYVLMPWLSKYRAMRRALLGYEDDGATILSAPLRAVSLVDARAYALRAVSLMPAASGFIGGSSYGFSGGPTDKDELRALRMENRWLRMQVRLMEKKVLKSDDEEGTYVPPPPMPSPISSPVVSRGSRDLRPDEGRMPSPPHPKLKKDYSAGLTELDGRQPPPSPPAWKRDYSAGLSNLRSPPSNLHQLSWKVEP